ncbi:MAG: ABC-type metal ion transport system periplasmic component/surface adhesin [Rhodocyclaceae bacterium]|nr:MAG: ABC-type metal ion transport system periplasmic component/surface adhesin [Rhodocyclaceae bacterium]
MKQFIFGLFFGLTVAIADAAPAHVHGEARLEISIDGEQLVIALESPLDSLLGFEHLPRDAGERQAVESMAAKLKEAGKVLVPSAAAQCASTGVELESPVLGGKSEPGGHNDLDARYTWRCAKPEALRDVATGLFGVFPRLQRIVVEFAGPLGQRAGRLDARNPRFSW